MAIIDDGFSNVSIMFASKLASNILSEKAYRKNQTKRTKLTFSIMRKLVGGTGRNEMRNKSFQVYIPTTFIHEHKFAQ